MPNDPDEARTDREERERQESEEERERQESEEERAEERQRAKSLGDLPGEPDEDY